MSLNEMEIKIAKLQEWEAIAEEAKVEAEALRGEIKSEMLKRDMEEMEVGVLLYAGHPYSPTDLTPPLSRKNILKCISFIQSNPRAVALLLHKKSPLQKPPTKVTQ